MNVSIDSKDVSDELAALVIMIRADRAKPTCDLPECHELHKMAASIRLTICVEDGAEFEELFFCSEAHKNEAIKRWGLV